MEIGRRLRTPDIDFCGYNLHEEFLRWLEFPVNNTMYKGLFLTLIEGITYIGSNNTSLGELLEMLPASRQNAEEITHLAEEKVIYYAYAFSTSKLGEIVSRDVCNTPRCIYSMKAVGEPNGYRNL